MCLKKLSLLAVILVIGITGCAAQQKQINKEKQNEKAEALPKSRLLEEDIWNDTAPSAVSKNVSISPELPDPEGAITLRQAISLALMKNPGLAAFSYEVRSREAKQLQESLLPNPEIAIESENLGGSGDFQGFDASETAIQLSQLIELAGKRPKRAMVAALDRNMAGWDYEIKRIDVLTEVTLAFIDVLAAQDRLILTNELASLAEQVYRTVSERVKAGKVSPIEKIKARVALSSSKIENNRAAQELEAAKKLLASTWGSASPAFEKVIGELYSAAPLPPLEQLTDLVSQNPDIERWAAGMAQHQAAVDLEDAKRIPDLTVSGGIRRFNETGNNAFVIGLSIPIPVFNRNQGRVLEARYRQKKAEKERRAAEIRVRTALAEAYTALSIAFSEATTLKEEALPGAQSAFDAANEGYRYGKFNYLDVLDAQRTLFAVRGQYIDSLAAYHRAVANVERLIGERLDTDMSRSIKKQEGDTQDER